MAIPSTPTTGARLGTALIAVGAALIAGTVCFAAWALWGQA